MLSQRPRLIPTTCTVMVIQLTAMDMVSMERGLPMPSPMPSLILLSICIQLTPMDMVSTTMSTERGRLKPSRRQRLIPTTCMVMDIQLTAMAMDITERGPLMPSQRPSLTCTGTMHTPTLMPTMAKL